MDTASAKEWRSVDWRFAIPWASDAPFETALLVGGSKHEAELLLESGWASVTRPDVSGQPCADAVVLRSDATIPIAIAASWVNPGGVLCVEIDRRRPRTFSLTPRRVTQVLRSCGLEPTGTYWVVGEVRRPKLYVPLDVDAALRWYAANVLAAPTFARRIVEALLRLAAAVGSHRLAWAAPCYLVTAVRGTSRSRRWIDAGHVLPCGSVRDADVRPLIMLGGDTDANRVAAIMFTRASRQPLAVAKTTRFADLRHDVIDWEHRVLGDLLALGDWMRRSVPLPLGRSKAGSVTVGYETCAPGRLLAASLTRRGVSMASKVEDLDTVIAWIREFHQRAQLASTWDRTAVDRWATGPLAEYAELLSLSPAEQRLFSRTHDAAAALIGHRLPIVWLHWTLAAQNIYRANNAITVIDWEGATVGPGLFDVLYFVLDWYLLVERRPAASHHERAWRSLYDPRGSTAAQAVHRALRRYMSALEIDQRFLPPLIVLMAVKRALGHLRLFRSPASAPRRARTDNRYVASLSHLARDADDLFDAQPRG